MSERSEFDETRNRRRANAAIATATRVLAGDVDSHPSYEDLAAVVDRSADDVTREIVSSHVAVCPTCAAELNDLRVFSGHGGRSLWRPFWLASTAAAIVLGLILAVIIMRSRQAPAPVAATPAADKWQRLASAALKSGHADVPPDIHALVAADAYRGDGQASAERAAVSPAGVVIDELRPQFRWMVASAETYQVVVYENGQPFAQSEPQHATAWTCSRPLVRGRTYRWQVIAHRGERAFIIPSPPAPPAIFRVLGVADHDELTRAVARHSADDLVLGVIYAHYGMLDPAREHLRKVGAQHLVAGDDFPR